MGRAAGGLASSSLRLIYDELCDAVQPMTARELAERIIRVKAMPMADDRQRELSKYPPAKPYRSRTSAERFASRQPVRIDSSRSSP
jgi:hypothetical protein